MRVSEITLPPLVSPPQRGALLLSLGAVSWGEAAPALKQARQGSLQARVAWWGDASGGEAVPLPAPGAAAACLAFPLHSGPKYLTRYLRDMGCLTISIEAAGMLPSQAANGCSDGSTEGQPATARALAVASVGLMALDVQAPVSGSFPLVLAPEPGAVEAAEEAPTIVGSLPVSLQLDYCSSGAAALLSSFELNEHLADAADAEAHAEHSEAAAGDTNSLEPARAMPGVPGVCGELAAALADRELASASLQQLAAQSHPEDAGDGAPLIQPDSLHQLLPLLLPGVSRQHVEYAAAMLLPCSSDSAAGVSLGELAAAASECAAVEQRLQQQPAKEAVRCLRQLSVALGSRTLDMAAAFGSAEGQRLTFTELGALLQRLHPPVTTEEARCLLALLAASSAGDGSCADGITLPALKAALAAVQESQQFPTAEDLDRQHAAAAVRRTKEAAAAAAAVIAEQRAAAAATAAAPTLLLQQQPRPDRKQAVRHLKSSSLQQRRRSSSGGSQQQGAQGSAAPQQAPANVEHQQDDQPKSRAQSVPAVVVGIPALPAPPPALPVIPPAAVLPTLPASSAPAGHAQLPAPTAATPEAAQAPEASPAVSAGPAVAGRAGPVPQQQAPDPSSFAQPGPVLQDPLLQLIQQAEQLKASLEQAGSRGSNRLAALASSVAGPRLPNLLLPGPLLSSALGSSNGSALMKAVADGSLSAATAALVATAKALRHEADQLPLPDPLPPVLPAALARAPRVPASAAAATPAATKAAAAPAAAPAAPTADATAAALKPATAWDCSDPESDAEDALLESLFFSQQPQAGAAAPEAAQAGPPPALALSPRLKTDQANEQQEQRRQQPRPEALLRVQLGSLDLAAAGTKAGVGGSVRCVVKPLQKGGQAQQLTLPVGHCHAEACQVELPLLPAAAAAAASQAHRYPVLPPYLFLEFWRHSGSLIGVARVPLLLNRPPAATPAARSATHPGKSALPAAVVAEGRQAVCNILDPEGREAGSIYIAAVLQLWMQDRRDPPLVAAVQHRFSVHIHGAHRLPSAAAYGAAGLQAPDGRVMRYSFPGEAHVLQTGEVACCSNPSFEARASHEMTVPATQAILPLLQEGLLRFELFDCWADWQAQQLHGWAALPLSDLASLVVDAQRSSDGSDGGGLATAKEASRTVLLPLCTEYDLEADAAAAAPSAAARGAAPSRAPSLRVELSYCAQLCTMGAAEAAAEAAAAVSAASQRAPAELMRPQQPGEQKLRQQQSQSCSSGPSGASDGESGDENSRRAANRSSADGAGSRQQWRSPRNQPAASRAEPAAASAAAAQAGPPAKPAQLHMPEEPAVPATVFVEIVRACGLAAAVREAAAACGPDSAGVATSLGRAAAVGPHAFARVALFAEDPSLQAQAPPLQTPFVAQSFAPAWHAAHSYQLSLTSGMLEALATQSLRVEVWHRCPRTAVTRSSDGGGQREVLLGAGSVPLLDVLRKRQGLRCWVNLARSSGGGGSSRLLGAVELAVRLSELAGVSAGSAGSSASLQDEPPLLLCPQAAALVPPTLRGTLLLFPGSGFSGQLAVLALHLDQLVPSASSRPKADRHFCSYRLPWVLPATTDGTSGSGSASGGPITTASRVLSAVGSCSAGGAGAGGVAFGSGGGSRRSSSCGGGTAGAGAPLRQHWAANMRHSGYFEVPAGPGLVAALLQAPLQVSVFKLPAAAGSSSVAAGRTAVLVGTVEVDLSPLLWPSGHCADEEAQRSLEAMCPVLSSAAAGWGCASLSIRAQLQLAPPASAAQQAAATAEQGRDVSSVAWQAERPGLPETGPAGREASPPRLQRVPPQQPGQRGSPQPAACMSSSDDDEELLQRCRRLLKPAAKPAQPQPPAHYVDSSSSSSSSSGNSISEAAGTTRQQQQREQRRDQGGPPTGTGQPEEQQAPAAGAGPGQSGPTSGSSSQQQQQQQSAAVPGGASPPWAPGLQEQHAATPAVQQQEPQAQAEAAGKLLVQVETALHLPELLPALAGGSTAGGSPGGASYAASVQVAWQPEQAGRQQQHVSACTEAVAVHAVEAAGLGGTAVWQQELELSPVAAAAWAACVHGSGGGSCPTLLVNVWAAGAEAASAGASAAAAPAAAPDLLVGCATVDLSSLLWQPEVRGWFQLISSGRQRSGQLKVAARLDAVLQRQLAALAADAGVAPPGSARGTPGREAAAEGAADLQRQLAAQLQELELLSRRLAAGPGQQEAAAEQSLQQPGGGAAGAAEVAAGEPGLQAEAMLLRELPGSDDEQEAAPVDARQAGFAWSGSDSEEDDAVLLGVAVEGAVSPGFSDVDAEEEAQRRARAPLQPALLVDQDWMFDISRPSAPQEEADSSAAGAAPADAASGASPQEEGPAGPRRPVRFRNVLPSTFLEGGLLEPGGAGSTGAAAPRQSERQLQQQQQQQQPAQFSQHGQQCEDHAQRHQEQQQPGTSMAAPAPPLDQWGEPAPQPASASATGGLLQQGWQFDISRAALAAPAAASSPDTSGQFAPMQLQQPGPGLADLSAQRQQLAEQTRRVRGTGGMAATIDDVIESLRPNTGAASSTGSAAPRGS